MKRRAFPGYGPEVDARYQRAGQWLLAAIYGSDKAADWCQRNDVAIQKAAAEGIGSSGGFIVPADLARAILDLRDAYGAFRRRALVWPMASDNTTAPRRAAAGITATFMAENAAGTETSASIDQLNLTARKLGALVKLSSELDEDSLADVVDYIANEVAFAFAAKEDDCAFNGDGTSTYGGMRGIATIVLDGSHAKAKVVAAGGHNTFLTLDGTDIANLMSAVQAAAIPNAAWFCSQTCFAQTFCRISASGGYLWTALVDGVVTPFYLGFPVILTQKLPLISTTLTGQVMLAFGDMYKAGVLGQRRGITLARSADRYLDQDQIAVLATQRFHTVIHDIGDNTNVGAIAALVAP